jgi:spermidine synthase
VVNSAAGGDPAKMMVIRFALAGVILLPLTLCLGAIFPVVVKAAVGDLERVGRSVGTLYSANTLGAIVGSFIAGFLLIPAFGVERSLVFSSVVNLILGVGLLCLCERIRMSLKVLAAVSLLPVVWWSFNLPDVWDRVIMLTAQLERRRLIRQQLAYSSFSDWRRRVNENFRCLLWKDGISSTVGVLQQKSGYGQKSLVTNGHVDASDGVDMSTQILLGAYPLLWKPDATEVGVVGWG